MILKNNAHPKGIDLGAVKTVAFSEMEMVGSASTGSGGWDNDMSGLFNRQSRKAARTTAPKPSKVPRVPSMTRNAIIMRASRARRKAAA